MKFAISNSSGQFAWISKYNWYAVCKLDSQSTFVLY
jgi:hypothetical protein